MGKAIFTTAYDVGAIIVSGKIGGYIGGLIGGPAGAIAGVLIGIGVETSLQYFKEEVVNWLDNAWDDFVNWLYNL